MAMGSSRRRNVMARSIKLGHCVCDPKQPCPCDTFKRYNVCQCAGERMPVKPGPAALTQLVHKAGCASKIGQADLLRILSNLPATNDPNVILGAAAGDDAGIYRIDDERALVQTVDVFTPCVDDPYLFGQIAAANSVSDVYAMGGRPLTALSVIGFPIEELDGAIMESMLRGGIDKMAEAGCTVVGGHSINDPEIKFGFAVTGLIELKDLVPRDTARPGDVLVLTKPLGTGMMAFAAQIGRISPEAMAEAGRSMATLNRDAAELMIKYGAHACTDITGYALAGHLVQMVRGSGVRAEIDLSRVPVFAAAAACLEQEVLPGAIERNQDYAMAWILVEDASCEGNLPILYDPQTSGGMLIALPEASARRLVDDLHARGHTAASIIGRIVEKEESDADGKVVIVNSHIENIVGIREELLVTSKNEQNLGTLRSAEAAELPLSCCDAPPADLDCCGPADASAPAVDVMGLFTGFMKEANKPGLIDARNKKLMAIALSISQRCEPCLVIHMKGALAMGITIAEIDEVAGLAIAFGGCSAMMFYKEVKQKVTG